MRQVHLKPCLTSTISFIIFWDPIFYQIFLSPQVERWAIITYKHGMYELPDELLNHDSLVSSPPPPKEKLQQAPNSQIPPWKALPQTLDRPLNTQACLELIRKSTMTLLAKIINNFKNFWKKTSSQMFDKVLNTPLNAPSVHQIFLHAWPLNNVRHFLYLFLMFFFCFVPSITISLVSLNFFESANQTLENQNDIPVDFHFIRLCNLGNAF